MRDQGIDHADDIRRQRGVFSLSLKPVADARSSAQQAASEERRAGHAAAVRSLTERERNLEVRSEKDFWPSCCRGFLGIVLGFFTPTVADCILFNLVLDLATHFDAATSCPLIVVTEMSLNA